QARLIVPAGSPRELRRCYDLFGSKRLGSRRLKWPRRCSQASKTKLGSPASAQIRKNQTQPVDPAMKPAPDERYVRPTAASAVNSAYCVAVCSGFWQSAERYATNITVPMALVKFSSVMATVSAVRSWPRVAAQENPKLAAACRIAPIHRLVASGSARATKPPAKPPASRAARPTPFTIAAYSLRVNPRSITNGAVIEPDSASVNLNSTTKASMTKAVS